MKNNRRGNSRQLLALGLAGMLLLQPVQPVMAAPVAASIQEAVMTVPEEAEPISEEYQEMPPMTYHEIEGEEVVGSVLDDPDYAGPDYAVIESRFSPLDAETRDLPPIKNQNPYGTCWAFSSLGMGETGQYVKKGETVDLSELHLAYFAYHTVNDPLGGLDGDSNEAIGATFMEREETWVCPIRYLPVGQVRRQKKQLPIIRHMQRWITGWIRHWHLRICCICRVLIR